MNDDEDYEHCDVCDHIYLAGRPCEGLPVACEACCTNSDGKVIYVPMFVMQELTL